MIDNLKVDTNTCQHCHQDMLHGKFCSHCGFPVKGSGSEQLGYRQNLRKKKQLLKDHGKSVNRARYLLYILAGLNLIIGGYTGWNGNDMVVLITSSIAAIIYFTLGIWSKSKPFPAILAGLFVYLAFQAINGIMDPATLQQAPVWKVLVIAGFVYGYTSAKKHRRLFMELSIIDQALGTKDGIGLTKSQRR